LESIHNDLKLYSLNKAKELLGIGRSTLERLIGEGLIKTITIGNNRKIPRMEIQRFINDNLIHERKTSSLSSIERKDITKFVNGQRADDYKQFDSVKLFEKIMEKNNGKCL
jgi:excisionase family DNA binding protein